MTKFENIRLIIYVFDAVAGDSGAEMLRVSEQLHKRGITQIICSNRRSHVSMAEQVVNLRLSAYIAYVLGADDADGATPDAGPVAKAMAALNVAPAHTLVVGDTPQAVLMGRAAGATTCAVTFGNVLQGEALAQAQADVVVDALDEITERMA